MIFSALAGKFSGRALAFVRGSMGCPALNFLEFFDGRPLPFFLGQCGASHAKKNRGEN